MIRVRQENEEVLYPAEEGIAIFDLDVEKLKELALQNKRRRIRLCTHNGITDKLHEMVVVHDQHCYVRPHKHSQNTESLLVLEGEADLVMYDEVGKVNRVIRLGPTNSGKAFYHRMPVNYYHSLIIRTNVFVFFEFTGGPFIRSNTQFPTWAPTVDGQEAVDYISKLSLTIDGGINS